MEEAVKENIKNQAHEEDEKSGKQEKKENKTL